MEDEIKEKEIEPAQDMIDSMRGDDDHIDIGDEPNTPSTPQPKPSPILKGAEEFNFKNGVYEINISSAFLRADDLMNLCFSFLKEFEKDKPNKKGTYIN